MSQVPPPGPASNARSGDPLDGVAQNILQVLLTLGALFLILPVGYMAFWAKALGASFPYVLWSIILAVLYLVASTLALMTSDRGTWTIAEGKRLLVLAAIGIFGFCLVGLGLTLPFAHTDIFGAPLTVWRNHMGLVLLVATLVLLGFFLMLIGLVLGRDITRRAPNLRRPVAGYNAIVGVILLVCILLVANLLPYIQFEPFLSLNRSYDWTASHMFSLEDSSKNLLAKLKEPVMVYVLMPAKNEATRNVETLLTACRGITTQIKWEVISPQLNPGGFKEILEKYKITSGGVLIVYGPEGKVSHEFIRDMDLFDTPNSPTKKAAYAFKGESVLMNALRYLMEGKNKIKVYFTQGHGEPELSPQVFGRNPRSFSVLREEIEKRNYETHPLTALGKNKPVPPDADLVVIAGPQSELDEGAIKALRDYAQGVGRTKKGRFIVLMPPAADMRGTPIRTNLEPFLADFSVKVGRDRVLALELPQPPLIVRGQPNPNGNNPIDKAFSQSQHTFQFYGPRSVTNLPADGAMPRSYSVEELITTVPGNRVWVETNIAVNPHELFADLLQNNPDALEAKFSRSPVSLAVAVSEGRPQMPPMPGHPPLPNTDSVPQMVVFGDTAWLTDQFLAGRLRTQHLDLFFSCGSWLREKPDVGSSAAPKERNQFILPDPPDGGWRLIVFPVVMALLCVVMLGGAVAIVRRR